MVEALVVEAGATAVVTERTTTGRRALWHDRHLLFSAIKAAHPGHQFLTTDVAVPYSEIAGAVAKAQAVAAEIGIDLTTAGHIGDGNVHGVIPYVDETYDIAKQFADTLVDYALSVGGTATGEHGIGLSKKRFLPAEHGATHDLMRTIKSVLDPGNLLNPGKVVDPWP
jgi:D-lactate dehydrogenase (cytochrome)